MSRHHHRDRSRSRSRSRTRSRSRDRRDRSRSRSRDGTPDVDSPRAVSGASVASCSHTPLRLPSRLGSHIRAPLPSLQFAPPFHPPFQMPPPPPQPAQPALLPQLQQLHDLLAPQPAQPAQPALLPQLQQLHDLLAPQPAQPPQPAPLPPPRAPLPPEYNLRDDDDRTRHRAMQLLDACGADGQLSRRFMLWCWAAGSRMRALLAHLRALEGSGATTAVRRDAAERYMRLVLELEP